jgi:hypothetical protein
MPLSDSKGQIAADHAQALQCAPGNQLGEFFLTQKDSASRARVRRLHDVRLLSSAESAAEKHQRCDERRG